MKINLFVKQTIKENYKYLLTILLCYSFLGILYHITSIEEVQVYGILLFTYGFTILHALVLPALVFKNYYHQTNINHLASIPLKRHQVFLSLYAACMGISIMMIIGFSASTLLMTRTLTQFIELTSALLMGFMYYYHLSFLAVVVCGDYLFQCVVQLILIFGPILTYIIYQWTIEMYVRTYLVSTQLSTLLYLIPGAGCAGYFMGLDPSIYYSFYLKEIVVLVILCLIGVYYRPNEKVGQGVVFHSLSYIVRSIAALLGTASLFALFGAVLGESDYISQIFIVIILSGLVTYFVELCYRKKVKVFYSLKYSVLVAFVVFGAVQLGIKVVEDYEPKHYTYFTIDMSDYSSGMYSGLTIKDRQLVQDLASLNKELLTYYNNNIDDIRHNQLFGHITIRFYNKNQDNHFSRQYSYTEQMKANVLNQEKYRDLLYHIFTKNEMDLLEKAKNRKEIVINVEENSYTIDEEHEFYLFENYLKQGMQNLYDSPLPILDALENDGTYMSSEDSDGYYVSYDSVIIYNALAKTFGF